MIKLILLAMNVIIKHKGLRVFCLRISCCLYCSHQGFDSVQLYNSPPYVCMPQCQTNQTILYFIHTKLKTRSPAQGTHFYDCVIISVWAGITFITSEKQIMFCSYTFKAKQCTVNTDIMSIEILVILVIKSQSTPMLWTHHNILCWIYVSIVYLCLLYRQY